MIDENARIADDIHDAYEEGYADGKRDAVVHGHWEITPIPILLRNNTTRTYYFKCNKCSFTSWNKNNYCSHCGAKMDFNDSNVLNALDQKEVNANALDEVTE